MTRLYRALLIGAAFFAGACCGDTEGALRVHVVDGENGATLQSPVVIANGETLTCVDNDLFSQPFPAPHLTDDGGVVVGPPGSDLGAPPPPSTHWCETWAANIESGQRTVKVSASGYFTTEVQVDLGDEGGNMSCPSPKDAEITVALYRRPT